MFFSSDNWAGVHPLIAQGLLKASDGFARAYGESDLDKALEERFCALFEREVAVFFVGTGTAANALSLASLSRSGGVIFAHEQAHIITSEGGAPEFLSDSSRICGVFGREGKINPTSLVQAINSYPKGSVHRGQPMAISLTQGTESGTLYSIAELEAIADIAKAFELPVHMDGARFANGLVALDCSPADMTWKCGVDILSFGATKNGCWCAEAIVVFDPDKAKEIPYLRKRAAHLFSKTRFIAAQFHAYFDDDLWLKIARHANHMAQGLRELIVASKAARLAWATRDNQVFVIVTKSLSDALRSQGAQFYDWPTPPNMIDGPINEDESVLRLVTSFATTQEDLSAFAALLNLS